MGRIGSDERVFEASGRIPILQQDLAIVAAAKHGRGATVLLGCVDAIRKYVVGGDVIELPGGLVIPGTPGFATVHGDDRSLIDPENHAPWILGSDPRHVEIIPTRSSRESFESLAAIGGAIH